MTAEHEPRLEDHGAAIPEGFAAFDGDGNTYPAGSIVRLDREMVDVTDEYGTFGPPDTYRKFRPGLTRAIINGVDVNGPVVIRRV